MFSIVEFSDGSGLSIVNTQWVTPRKREVFWPPAKDQHAFNKLVRKPDQEIDQDLWQLYGISRVFYETAFQILLSQILQVKEQNKKILSLLEANSIQNNTSVINSSSNIPTDFPITLPLKSIGEIETLEGFLKEQINIKKVVSYFSTIGGTDVKQKTHKLLRFLLTNELASQFNYCGRNRKEAKKIDQCTKKGFSEYFLCKAIIESVKANTDYTTSAVEVVIKNWLKHAPHRIAKEH